MEEELREKMYDMHGTVQRLDQKMDSIIKKQGNLENEVDHLNQDIDEVSEQANANQKKLYGLFFAGSAGATALGIAAAFASTGFP